MQLDLWNVQTECKQMTRHQKYHEYTTKWIKQVNRGGLFQVNDDAYHLCHEIEIAMQYKLTEHIKATTTMSDTQPLSKEIFIT